MSNFVLDRIKRQTEENFFFNKIDQVVQNVTNQQNQANKGSKVGSTSKYKGVFWCKDSRAWKASIYYQSKSTMLGYYICEKDAALAYNKKAFELNGEYAYLNKIED